MGSREILKQPKRWNVKSIASQKNVRCMLVPSWVQMTEGGTKLQGGERKILYWYIGWTLREVIGLDEQISLSAARVYFRKLENPNRYVRSVGFQHTIHVVVNSAPEISSLMSLDRVCLEDSCRLYFIVAKAEGSISMYNVRFMLQSDACWSRKHDAKGCQGPESVRMPSCTALVVKLLSCISLSCLDYSCFVKYIYFFICTSILSDLPNMTSINLIAGINGRDP